MNNINSISESKIPIHTPKKERKKREPDANVLFSIYEQIVQELNWDHLPKIWKEFDFNDFSPQILLHHYQSSALKHGVLLLNFYYSWLKISSQSQNLLNLPIYFHENSDHLKAQFYSFLQERSQNLSALDFKIDVSNSQKMEILREFYPIFYNDNINIRISSRSAYVINFKHFVNRMTFWMATGSGKSLIIIKMIEFLHHLIQNKQIPDFPFLILTQRDDLILQFQNIIDQYNQSNCSKITLHSLNTFGSNQYLSGMSGSQINVYIYRSDLIAEASKEKEISYQEIENEGGWYLFLDEAHKGDREDSIRKIFYSILSRNGFLFNFSATFTDDWDIFTTVFNFNLARYIESGYGKNICIFKRHLLFLKKNKENVENAAQLKDLNDSIISLLKPLILLALVIKSKRKLKEHFGDLLYYHNPILICLVNSVNVEYSDLETFFLILVRISKGLVDESQFRAAKIELLREGNPKARSSRVHLGDSEMFEPVMIDEITFDEMHEFIFHSKAYSTLEVSRIEGNKEELALKLKVSDKPFGLIKIGDILPWIKQKLVDYEVVDSINPDKFFSSLNSQENPVSILMGSRSFYEGWDSNRPNIMVFLNIGNIKARKFAVQAIGRGLRIEPVPTIRKRIQFIEKNGFLENLNKKFGGIKQDLKIYIYTIETLFIFGTNADALISLLEYIDQQKKLATLEKTSNTSKISDGKNNLLKKEIQDEGYNGEKEQRNKFEEWVDDPRIIFYYRKVQKRT